MIRELKRFFETLFFALMLVLLVVFTPGNGGLLLLFYLLCSILFQFGLLSFQLNIFIFMVVNIFFIIIIYIFSSKNSKDFDKEDFPYLLGAYTFLFFIFLYYKITSQS